MHATLTDVLADLVQNSVEAGSKRILIVFEEENETVRFTVEDNGRGMDERTRMSAEDPFWTDGIKHPDRRVGLGIPFLRQTASQCDGRVDISSAPGVGTTVKAEFPADHLDLPPTGDLALLWVQCLTLGENYGMSIRRLRRASDHDLRSYEIDRDEVAEALGGLEDAGALGLLKEYCMSLEESLMSEQIDEEGV